ncbi:hypothetical protein QEN19_003959 [Hanseniaspora menglaensis]
MSNNEDMMTEEIRTLIIPGVPNKHSEDKKTEKKQKQKVKILLTDDIKKMNHIKSEHRRRNLIKERHLKLIKIVPKLDLLHPIYSEKLQSKSASEEFFNVKSEDDASENISESQTVPSKKLIAKLEQEVHAERSIYKLSKEYLTEQYSYNSQLKEYIAYLLSNGEITQTNELKQIYDQIQ